MTITTYEKNERGRVCAETLKGLSGVQSFERIFVLPIPSLREDAFISGYGIRLEELIETLRAGDLVGGYGIPAEHKLRIKEKGALVADCSMDEEFVLQNARLTALGALGILLTNESVALSDMRVGIVGYGRIGKYLTEMLLYIGSRVCVFTSKKNTCLELCEAGVESQITLPNADISRFDILINTAPAKIFEIEKGNKDLPKIMDLASGKCFPEGVAQKYPSLPARMYPLSAGKIFAQSIERCIGANK